MMEHRKYKHRSKTDYECKRDLLIPVAERFADSICGTEPDKAAKHYRKWADFWNKEYHQKMNELARGL